MMHPPLIAPPVLAPPATRPVPTLSVELAQRRNNFNFLRLLFASLVILSHSSELIDGNQSREPFIQFFQNSISFGGLAVDGFFLLSGYLIVQSWASSPRPLSFLTKRVLRIYPGFIVASLLGVLVVGPLASEPLAYFSRLELSTVIKDIVLLRPPTTPPVFEDLPYPAVNGAMWTISREFLCYLLVLVVGLAGGIKDRRIWLILTLGIFAVLVVSRLGHPVVLFGRQFNLTNPIIHLATFFLAGGSFFLFKDKIKFRPYLAWLFACVLFICLFSSALAELALVICGGYLLIYFAVSSQPALSAFQTAPDISYGVYLYGWPVQMLLIWHLGWTSPWTLFLAALLLAGLLGLVSWYAVEKPFLKLKRLQWGWPRHPARQKA